MPRTGRRVTTLPTSFGTARWLSYCCSSLRSGLPWPRSFLFPTTAPACHLYLWYVGVNMRHELSHVGVQLGAHATAFSTCCRCGACAVAGQSLHTPDERTREGAESSSNLGGCKKGGAAAHNDTPPPQDRTAHKHDSLCAGQCGRANGSVRCASTRRAASSRLCPRSAVRPRGRGRGGNARGAK